jgi:hypothetical protein
MKNFKPAIRIIAAIIIVLGIAGLFIIWNKLQESEQIAKGPSAAIKAPADGSIAIKIEGFGFAPFSTLAIKGGGYDKDAATAVIFTTHTGEVLTIPALEVTSDTVIVPVPPLKYDKTKGAFSPGQASLRVVQMKKTGSKLIVKTSDQSSLFMVYPPTLPSALVKDGAGEIPKGAVTQLVVAATVAGLKSAADKVPADNPELSAAILKAQAGMEKILKAAETIMKNPKTTYKLGANTGSVITMSVDDLAWLDAFYAGYLGMLEKTDFLAAKENINTLVPAASAQSQNACVTALLNNELRIKILDTVAIQFCNAIEPEAGIALKPGDERLVKWEYFLQTPLILTLALADEASKWSVFKQVGIATALSMGLNFAYEHKLPDWWSLGSLAVGIRASHLAALGKPFLGELTFAMDMWDNLCAVFPKSGCLDSKAIILGSGQILVDLVRNPENLLYIGREMVDGLLAPLVDAVLIPKDQSYTEFDGTGEANGGYDEVKPPVPAPKPKPTPEPKSEPVVVPDPAPNPTPKPAPAPTPSCDQVKEDAYAKCIEGCGPEPDISSYNECTAGCAGDLLDKANCINGCISAWSKIRGDRSKCFTDCLNAKYDTVCP